MRGFGSKSNEDQQASVSVSSRPAPRCLISTAPDIRKESRERREREYVKRDTREMMSSVVSQSRCIGGGVAPQCRSKAV